MTFQEIFSTDSKIENILVPDLVLNLTVQVDEESTNAKWLQPASQYCANVEYYVEYHENSQFISSNTTYQTEMSFKLQSHCEDIFNISISVAAIFMGATGESVSEVVLEGPYVKKKLMWFVDNDFCDVFFQTTYIVMVQVPGILF